MQATEHTERYKETELGWLPESWEIRSIAELIEKTKQTDMRKSEIEFKYIDVSGIDRSSLKIIEYNKFKGREAPSRARKIVKKNDVIIATVRPTLKRIALVGEEFDNEICSTAFCVLRAKPQELNYEYLYYTIQRKEFIDNLGKIQRGASYPAVTDSDVKNQQILVPPFSEQYKIAHVLSIIQTAQEKTNAVITALHELKKSMMKHLFTYGPVSVKDKEKVKLKETEIGLVPEDWDVVNLGNLLSLDLRNGLYKPKEYYGNGNIKIIQLNDLYSSERILNIKKLQNISLNDNEVKTYIIQNNDCIVNRVSKRKEGIGKLSIVKLSDENFPIVFESNMFRLRLNKQKIDCDFISYFSQDFRYIQQAQEKSQKGNQTSINQGSLKSILIPLPSIPIQQKITFILLTIDMKIETEKTKKNSLNELFKSMLHNLMTAKIRVNTLGGD